MNKNNILLILERNMTDKNKNNSLIILILLLFGTISMYFGQVMTYASPLWFLNIGDILFSFPNFILQSLFFINIALRYKKTDFKHLYLLGVLFGLYEAWITKVVFNGYSSDVFWGKIGGIAIFETLTLVFFFHPVFSFILPIMIVEIYAYTMSKDINTILPNHIKYFEKDSLKTVILFLFVVLWPSAVLGVILGTQILSAVIAIMANWLIILILISIINRKSIDNKTKLSIYDLKLSDRNFKILTVLLVIYYLIGLFLNKASLLPNIALPYIIVFTIYGLTIYAFHRSNYVYRNVTKANKEYYDLNMIKYYLIAMIILPVMLSGILILSSLIYLTINFLMIAYGSLYYLKSIIEAFKE